MAEFILERGNYWAIIGLMMIGLYIAFSATNLIKRLVGLGLFQTSIILFYISLSRINGGTAPIYYGKDYKAMKAHSAHPPSGGEVAAADSYGDAALHSAAVPDGVEAAANDAYGAGHYGVSEGLYNVYSNPLPHVLMLTAIVVGVATLAVGLAIIVRIREAYGTIESDEIRAMDLEVAISEAADELEEAQAGAQA